MKSVKYFIAAVMISAGINNGIFAQQTDSVKMGPGYGNDVFYSLENGFVKQEPNNNWHIAFSSSSWSSTILTNDGTGIVLYTYPRGDSASWDTMSIAGIESWKPMYNSPEDWYMGAFDRHATGHPDYGWGVYSSISHDVIGDSLFVIQLPDQSYKKLRIHKKISIQNTYKIQYANLDGTADTTVMLEINPYTAKNFAYYSFDTHELIDREPAESWDILFTRYFDETIPYIVTGVLSNTAVSVARMEVADTASFCFNPAEFSESRSAVGSDWKSFNMGIFSYELADSLVFVIKDTNDVNHNLFFTEFAGSSTGKISFRKSLEQCATYTRDNIPSAGNVQIYPVPANDFLNLKYSLDSNGPVDISIYNLTGKRVMHQQAGSSGDGEVQLELGQLKAGVYLLEVRNLDYRTVRKFSIR